MDGVNTVSRDASGITTVTNKYGVTTGFRPDGKQTAYGSTSIPGISGPNASKIGGMAKTAAPVAIAGLLGGPVAALGALAVQAMRPGGLLSGLRNIDTSKIGTLAGFDFGPTTAFAKARSGGAFPTAPSGGYGTGGSKGASFSTRSRGEMDGISPGASKAIGAGKGGLY